MNGTLAVGMPQGWEWIIILVIGLVLFGGYKKLPEVGGSLAASIRNFKRGMDQGASDEEAASTAPVTAETTTETTTTKTQTPS